VHQRSGKASVAEEIQRKIKHLGVKNRGRLEMFARGGGAGGPVFGRRRIGRR